MIDIGLADGTVLDATDGHPIWDATANKFTDASNLRVGDQVLSVTDALISITRLAGYQADIAAYNLQINTIHTYYAGTTPVLVHNSCTSAADILGDPSVLEDLTPSQIDDLARNADFEVLPGKTGAANPATRYYLRGTNRSVGFRVLPEGVAGQSGVKAGPYLKFFGGPNDGLRIGLSP
jgi:hypothetical protein